MMRFVSPTKRIPSNPRWILILYQGKMEIITVRKGQTPPQQTHPAPWADTPPPPRWLLQRTVRILLECMLVTVRKRSLGQGYVFTGVCHSVNRGGGSASVHVGIHPPAKETPPPPAPSPPPPRSRLQRTVRILLECVLVVTEVIK